LEIAARVEEVEWFRSHLRRIAVGADARLALPCSSRVDLNYSMKWSSSKLAGLLMSCAAVSLLAYTSFNWYLKVKDRQLTEQLKASNGADDKPSVLDVTVAIPEELLSALDKPGDFRVSHRVSDIPDPVKVAFAKATQESTTENKFLMAEPGAWPWNATDVIREGLPRRRLKSVAINDSLCLVFYEHGGFGKSDDVAVFRVRDNEAQAIWHSNTDPKIVGPADLRNAIQTQTSGNLLY
jgi:hypothetical protein